MIECKQKPRTITLNIQWMEKYREKCDFQNVKHCIQKLEREKKCSLAIVHPHTFWIGIRGTN